MNNDKPNVDDVFRWIEDYHQSKHDYADCKQDTETAVNFLEKDFVKIDFRDADEIVNWFVSEFQMKGPQKQSSDKDPSYYRGFVAIENDNIINLRVSRHYGTKESLQRAYGGGKHKPDLAYYIIVDKKPITYNNSTPITNECFLLNIKIIVDEWFLSAMKSDKDKRDIVFKLVYVLTFGDDKYKTNESVEHNNINNTRKIYKSNMTHIMKIDEFINEGRITKFGFRDAVFIDKEDELVKKYKLKFNPSTGLYDCDDDVIVEEDLVNDGELIINFGTIGWDFDCSSKNLTSLKGCPQEVGRDFICSYNKLTTLEGAPQKVDGDFDCRDNELTTLEGAPQKVDGDFNCHDNKLTSLKGAPQEVGGDFDCTYSKLISLKGAPQKVGGSFDCEGNKLITLEGAPQEVGGSFYCDSCELTSLEGSPKIVGGSFRCFDNKLTSLEGGPEEVGDEFNCSYNKLTSLEGAPQKVGGSFDYEGNIGLINKK